MCWGGGTLPLVQLKPAPPQMAKTLNRTIRDQNKGLDEMGSDMDTAQNSLSVSINKIGELLTQGGSMHLCHLVAFAVVVFLLLYWVFMRK